MQIHTIDLDFRETPHAIAAYLAIGRRGPVLFETGPASAVDTMQARLAEHGYSPSDIRHIFVTHIHLDHAGATGWWAQQGAQIYVHPNGAKHLIDPSKLLDSAERIYGDMMQELWGQTKPTPQDSVTVIEDGEEVQVEGLNITAIDTPGHAYHHHTFRLGNVGFTGDASGNKMPGCDFVTLPTPPPQFNLEAWHMTLSRLLKEDFAAIYPTHFGAIENVQEHLEDLTSILSQTAEFVRGMMQAKVGRRTMIDEFMNWNRKRALTIGLSEQEIRKFEISNPMSMSVDGLIRYWTKNGV